MRVCGESLCGLVWLVWIGELFCCGANTSFLWYNFLMEENGLSQLSTSSAKNLKILFRKYEVIPKKTLGQHFLIDGRVLWNIITTADLTKRDTVLEIGPGTGVLTKELAKRAERVIAIEKDRKMVELLRQLLGNYKNAEIVQGDILLMGKKSKTKNKTETELEKIIKSCKHYKVVANLPYSIASRTIRLFLESSIPPQEMVLMLQKEIAQRICAKPPKMNLLAIAVQFYAKPKIIQYVPQNSFWPRPNVDSAIIRISEIKKKQLGIDSELFFKIVKAGFSHPRKQLLNNLPRALQKNRVHIHTVLAKNGINPAARAEELSLEEWLTISRAL